MATTAGADEVREGDLAGRCAVAPASLRDPLRRSFRYCEQIARTKAANFYPAFRLLPGGQYRAMCALYAFLRIADDLSDEPGDVEDKRRSLDAYRRQLDLALCGEYHHPLYPALADT